MRGLLVVSALCFVGCTADLHIDTGTLGAAKAKPAPPPIPQEVRIVWCNDNAAQARYRAHGWTIDATWQVVDGTKARLSRPLLAEKP